MNLEKQSVTILLKALEKLESGFHLPQITNAYHYEKIEEILLRVAEKMQDNYPYFHPYYIGQMLNPPHPVARIAYMLSMWINPNNHALDGGKASSAMEKEVVKDIATMYGWKKHLGHLTSGGTFANLEALWIAGKIHPGKMIVGSEHAHYTHQRISEVLGLSFHKIKADAKGRMDLDDLEKSLSEKNVGTVVVTMGTTGAGAVDPLKEIIELQKKYSFRIHADAAYGGYFGLSDNLNTHTKQHYDQLKNVDSIVVDPHKHGLQPYGCGSIIFQDPSVSKYYLHDSPYTYFSSDDLHLGEISLECSRAGSSAVALWATHQLMPLIPNGEFAETLHQSRAAALDLYHKLSNDNRFFTFLEPELDIVIWSIRASTTEEMSMLAKKFFKTAESKNIYLSVYHYPCAKIPKDKNLVVNSENLTCLRACLMKPEHAEWLERIWEGIESAF